MRVKLQFLATLICGLGIALGFACKLWFPKYWTDWYVVVLVVYWFMEMVISFILGRYEGCMSNSDSKGTQFVKTYMIAKAVKMLVTVVFIGFGISTLKKNNTEMNVFVGSAVAFYLINLAVETALVTKNKK